MKKRIPGRFHPGIYIKEEMEARGWSILKMCYCCMGTPEDQFDPKILGAILKGECSVDKEVAKRLNRAFGASAVFWLNLQRAYDEGEEK